MPEKEIPKKKFALSKKVTVYVFIALALGGIISAFKNSFIEIDSYIKFLSSFAPFFIAYITIVGAGRSAKNIAEKKYNNGQATEGDK